MRIVFRYLLFLILVSLAGWSGTPGNAASTLSQTTPSRQQLYKSETGLKCLLYWPLDYSQDSLRSWPVVLYLHGFNHSGSDPEVLKRGGFPLVIEKGGQYPFLVVSPQCPQGDNWRNPGLRKRLKTLLDELLGKYRIDPLRIYLTGFSMGGDGAWYLAMDYPDLFAAMVPVGSFGYSDTDALGRLKDLPIWIFHGGKDQIVNVSCPQRMADALASFGGNVTLTIFPGTGHDESGYLVYHKKELYDWLEKQKR